ncbi:hypothetical protein EV174_002115, partial [Coemansia sp. RSA 2320]
MEDTVHPNELKAWDTEFQALDDNTIHAMASLMSVIGPDSDLAMEIAKIPTMRNRANYDYEQMRARGQAQFNCVYGSQAMEVHEEVRGLYPELAEVAI